MVLRGARPAAGVCFEVAPSGLRGAFALAEGSTGVELLEMAGAVPEAPKTDPPSRPGFRASPRREWRASFMTTSSAQRVVIMGVSGSGKTTVGSALAARLGWRFIDGDALHPPANIVKMSEGTPLTDTDRAPWLAAVARQLDSDGDAIAACSALRRAYRLAIAEAVPRVFFVHLIVPRATLAARMRTREGHFMPASLLDSQLSTLEPLGPEESGIAIDAARELDSVVTELAGQLAGC